MRKKSMMHVMGYGYREIEFVGIELKKYRIMDESLWEATEPENPLSELIEVSSLEYLGLEDGRHTYICKNPTKEIVGLLNDNFIEDDHIYLFVDKNNLEKVWLWPY